MVNKNTQGFHAQSWTQAVHQLSQSGTDYVLVTLLGTAGSTPRGEGTKMVVTRDDMFDTVGGGHLEFKIIEQARVLLASEKHETTIKHFPLGASLGQCCGGSVSVLFECLVSQRPLIQLHGAGHVGHALVQILAQLPVRVQWVDSRAELFPDSLPANVQAVLEPEPVDAVIDAPPNTLFLILTHNHQRDFALTEAAIKRNDAELLGVIGSETKAKRFRLRLEHKGVADENINQMICPVGLTDVRGKLPMEVAVSISGQIIAHYQGTKATHTRAGLQWKTLKQELIQHTETRNEENLI